jgi:hypothetical protein
LVAWIMLIDISQTDRKQRLESCSSASCQLHAGSWTASLLL